MLDREHSSVSQVCMDVTAGQAVAFPALGISVELVYKSGRSARLRIRAPRAVEIRRGDPLQDIAKDRSIGGDGLRG